MSLELPEPARAKQTARLRALPAVDRLAASLAEAAEQPATGTVALARMLLDERRAELCRGPAHGDGEPAGELELLVARGRERLRPSLRRVLNATGVVLHTNLGRAPLAPAAAEAVGAAARGYVNLELDLATGGRGARDDHARGLLCELTGAQDAMVVNNGAAAALLAVAALAGPGGTVIVSRGQLVEIGGGFRVPEVIAQAGARLVEVGTTNRTRRADVEAALVEHPEAVLLRVHPSNFRVVGFVAEVGIGELCALGAPVIDDVGSGVLVERAELPGEPGLRASVTAGAALTCSSADKLLGGPQSGLLVGTREAIARCRRHPLARALRPGRLVMAGLEATLALHRDPETARRELPVLAALERDPAELARCAGQLADATGGVVVHTNAKVGGGSLPLLELPGPAVAYPGVDPGRLAAALRAGDPPLLGRIVDGTFLADPRTLTLAQLEEAAVVLRATLPLPTPGGGAAG